MQKDSSSKPRHKGSFYKRNVTAGLAYVTSTFNNTRIVITDVQGNTIAWSTAGLVGFSGSKQSTPYAAQIAAEDAARKAQACGVKTVEVLMQGPGAGKETAVRALSASGICITVMRDVTPVPHNGCRPPKRRRV